MGWEDEPMQAVEATGPHNLCLGTTIPKASHRLWAFGYGAYGGRSLAAGAMMPSAQWCLKCQLAFLLEQDSQAGWARILLVISQLTRGWAITLLLLFSRLVVSNSL